MLKFFVKIFKTPNNIISFSKNDLNQMDFFEIGEKIQDKVKKMFSGSLAIRQIDAGSDNACEQELVALSNSFYDIERFGIHFVASPRHADMLLVTGPVTRNMVKALKDAYDGTPDPKIVVAIGDDAIGGGIFKDSYAVLNGVDSVIPVDYQIPGDPPTPTFILQSLLKILETIENKPSQKK